MTLLMAVPDARLVTSVLQWRINVNRGMKILIQDSFFFNVIAPVSSTEDSIAVGRGNRALHFPHLLSMQLAYVFFFFLVPSFKVFLFQLCTFKRSSRSSVTVRLVLFQSANFLQRIQDSSASDLTCTLHGIGGGMGIVIVGST